MTFNALRLGFAEQFIGVIQLAGSKTKPDFGTRSRRYIQHHGKFWGGIVAAIIASVLVWDQSRIVRMLAAGDAFYVVYLSGFILAAMRSTPESTVEHARWQDEGLPFIAAVTLGAAGVSLTAIFFMLFSKQVSGLEIGLAVASVPLGWATVHASFAVHYARMFHKDMGKGKSRGGLDFPGEDNPDLWDFLYFSFVIGMTAQTSDTGITEKPLRRLALAHGVVSFFYNTVILAVSVNAAVQAAG